MVAVKISDTELQILNQLSISLGWEDIADPRNEYHLAHITPDEYLYSCRKLKLLGYIEMQECNDIINGVNSKINSQGLNFLNSQIYINAHVENPRPKPHINNQKTLPSWATVSMWLIGIIISVVALLKTLDFI